MRAISSGRCFGAFVWMQTLVALPIIKLTHAVKALAGGQQVVSIPGLMRRDEIGRTAEALSFFQEALKER